MLYRLNCKKYVFGVLIGFLSLSASSFAANQENTNNKLTIEIKDPKEIKEVKDIKDIIEIKHTSQAESPSVQIPEPSTYLILGMMVAAAIFLKRKQQRGAEVVNVKQTPHHK